MSWTSITTRSDVVTLTRAERIRRLHTKIRRGFRKICSHCRTPWGKYGCALYLWATDVLSRMSRIVVANPPERPNHRHRADYTRLLARAAEEVRRHFGNRPEPCWSATAASTFPTPLGWS